MTYNLKGIQKLINDIEEKRQKEHKRIHYKQIGYAPRCKVCNSEYLKEIEDLRQKGYTYDEILQELEITNISIMSLSRHFKNHYPNSKEYKEKQQLQALKNIQEAYIKYPFLEDYFKNKDLEDLEDFNNNYGFCTDTFTLCDLIPASKVKNCNQCINLLCIQRQREKLEAKENNIFLKDNDLLAIDIKFLIDITDCLNCKNEYNEKRINLLEKIITYHILNIPPENKELYYNLLNFNGSSDDFIKMLMEEVKNTS